MWLIDEDITHKMVNYVNAMQINCNKLLTRLSKLPPCGQFITIKYCLHISAFLVIILYIHNDIILRSHHSDTLLILHLCL